MKYTIKQRLLPVGLVTWRNANGILTIAVTQVYPFCNKRDVLSTAVRNYGYALENKESGVIAVVDDDVSGAHLAYLVEEDGKEVKHHAPVTRKLMDFSQYRPPVPEPKDPSDDEPDCPDPQDYQCEDDYVAALLAYGERRHQREE
jgi:hypothetical protein